MPPPQLKYCRGIKERCKNLYTLSKTSTSSSTCRESGTGRNSISKQPLLLEFGRGRDDAAPPRQQMSLLKPESSSSSTSARTTTFPNKPLLLEFGRGRRAMTRLLLLMHQATGIYTHTDLLMFAFIFCTHQLRTAAQQQ